MEFDSLVSVRIREWFLKELGVNVLVLKLMSTNHTLSRAESQTAKAHDNPQMDWQKEVAGLTEGIPSLIPPGGYSAKDVP
ncbi:Male sterility NAD-binding [Penicillium hordei]|uniref:Male sterility NAD-binding n=1 Tax=Penicillium hordei TaxID=40994 RepID=A0AAD6H332_9EURO|nr:Male sterility NAD-binding [Penicillium hordei]KAJ5602397.1 Male sterility NAD-binding [Penicillium hordei]